MWWAGMPPGCCGFQPASPALSLRVAGAGMLRYALTGSRERARGGRSRYGRVRLLQQLRKTAELRQAQVGDDPVGVLRGRPLQQVIALLRRHAGAAAHRPPCLRPEEHVDQVLAPPVHERRDRTSAHVVEPPADEWEPPPGEVIYRRREIQFAVEPRL